MKAVVLALDERIADQVAALIASTLALNGYTPGPPSIIDWPDPRPEPLGFGDDPSPGFDEVRWRIAALHIGGHVHVKVRCGRAGSRGLAGTLVLREDEWPEFAARWPSDVADVTYEKRP